MKEKLAIVVIVLSLGTVMCKTNEYRLPKSVVPYFYDISLEIDPEHARFEGYVEITVDVVNAVNMITMHAVELYVNIVSVYSHLDRTNINHIKRLHSNTSQETISIVFEPNILHMGKYTVNMEYSGEFNTAMKGLYVTNYTRYQDGLPKSIAVTHFQTTNARRVFPCFDEPEFIADFKVYIKRNKKYIAVSNMPLQHTVEQKDGQFLDIFENAPRLSTYHLAFALGNFFNSSYSRGNVYTSPSHSTVLQTYLTDVSESVFRAMEVFLHIPLPIKKIDIITVRHLPGIYGGLSNWGLILLSDERLTSNNYLTEAAGEQNALLTVARVYLQQFFGNIIIPKWWNHTWLNDGIANYLKYWVGDQVKPEWRLLDQRNLLIIREAIENDTTLDFYPRLYSAGPIYYQRASAIMLTLEGIIGTTTFREGLRRFLNRHSGAVFKSEDIWNDMQDSIGFDKARLHHIQQIIKRDFVKIMESWKNLVGVPVLYAFKNYSSSTFIRFTQQRLTLEDGHIFKFRQLYIPINFITKSNTSLRNIKPTLIFDTSEEYKYGQYLTYDEWCIINPEATYFYLVNYDNTNWKRLANALQGENFGNIPPVTRGKLLYDAFTLARYRMLKYDVALELIKYLRREKDYTVWNSFFYVFDYFYLKHSGTKNFHYLQAFLANALQPALEHVGFHENQTLSRTAQHIDNLNRLQLIKWACLLGNAFCRNTATRLLKKWDIHRMSPELRKTVVCAGLIDAEESIWNAYFHTVIEDDSDASFSSELGCSQNSRNLHTYIESFLNFNISEFDQIYPRGNFGINFVLDYLVQNGERVKNALRSEDLAHIFKELTIYINTEEQLNKLRNVSSALEISKLSSLGVFSDKEIEQISKEIKLSLEPNDIITKWITNEIINQGDSPARASLCVIIVLVLISSLF